jgi:hypothetical protein
MTSLRHKSIMSKSEKLIVLLGAGFSKPAGLPLAAGINSKFDRNNEEQLLRWSSGEWLWKDENPEEYRSAGTEGPSAIPYTYILTEFVDEYKRERGGYVNYEDMYQFLLDNQSNKSLAKKINENARTRILKNIPALNGIENPKSSLILSPFENNPFSRLIEIINYLIGDLVKTKCPPQRITDYHNFINLLRNYSYVDIFSLNHDLILEQVLDEYRLHFANGFDKNGSEIFIDNDQLPSYQSSFSESVNVYKLHGGIGQYSFPHGSESANGVRLDGKCTYFFTLGYYEKHGVSRKNPETHDIIQSFHSDTVPKFLTGTDKIKLIAQDRMYEDLYKRFDDHTQQGSDLLVAGYSYGDRHINEKLKSGIFNTIVNVNPNTDFPYDDHAINLKAIHKIKV